jgi:hypothetical protein
MTVSGVSFMSGRKARKSWCGPELVTRATGRQPGCGRTSTVLAPGGS